ncbi:uncharacterized protein LOC120824844 isoform X1 [Gasterosteus aculeatus]
MENYSYFFFLRMDENYNILPHGVNFQDAIFADTSDNRPTFSSLFQFSNSTQGSHSFHVFSFLVGHTGGQQDLVHACLTLNGTSAYLRAPGFRPLPVHRTLPRLILVCTPLIKLRSALEFTLVSCGALQLP